MAWVPIIVEFSPATNPLDSPIWIDITPYVVGTVAITRGRASEFKTFASSQCSMVLDNSSRRFDPTYSAGPYFGNLRARKKLRVRTSAQTLFTGYVAGWPQTLDWISDRDTVTITASDALGALAGLKIDTLAFGGQVQVDGAISYRPITDPALGVSAAMANVIPNQHDVRSAVNPLVWGDEPGFLGLSPYSVGFGERSGGISLGSLWATSPSAETLELWLKVPLDEIVTYQRDLLTVYGAPLAEGPLISVSPSGLLRRASVGLESSVSIADGLWHHVVWTSDGTTMSIYIDGALNVSVATASKVFALAGPGTSTFYLCRWVGLGTTTTARMREIAVYPLALTASQVANHYSAAAGWAGETAGQRIGHILDIADWPSADRSLDVGSVVVPAVGRITGAATDLCQTCAVADGGALWCSPAGSIVFRSRMALNEVAAYSTVQGTFGNSGADHRFVDAQPAQDDLFIRNDLSVSRDGGPAFKFIDATSISRYLPISDDSSMGLFLANDNDVVSRGNWLLANYAEPPPRLASLVLNARFSAGLSTLVTTLDIWSKIVVKIPHSNVGTTTTYTVNIEAISHRIDVGTLQWMSVFSGPPAPTVTYFIIGTDALGSAQPMAH